MTLLISTACQPPAADDYLERGLVEETVPEASEPLPSPDASDALWAPSDQAERLLYGVPGETPFLAVACDRSGGEPVLVFTRFTPADRNAQAMMSLVGNFHVARFPVDATDTGRAWLWQGSIAADSPDLNTLTGQRDVEATIPGAGSVMLKASPRIRELVNACRPSVAPDAEEAERDLPDDEPPEDQPRAPK
ncbi:hypothetical protein [Erythrobacter litoralis]|uniref:hypothetical protein n=1 Tax=Erythrobacter litoralis TaxID=39960 RepID=UPI0012DCF421|nr:hypothetical protein [Erythrobacter litoralis]